MAMELTKPAGCFLQGVALILILGGLGGVTGGESGAIKAVWGALLIAGLALLIAGGKPARDAVRERQNKD